MNTPKLKHKIAESILNGLTIEEQVSNIMDVIDKRDEAFKELILKRTAQSWDMENYEDVLSKSEIDVVKLANFDDPDYKGPKGRVEDGSSK